MEFEKLKIGQKFECWGDEYLNYDYPKICQCIKVAQETAQEIDGVRFGITKGSEVTPL